MKRKTRQINFRTNESTPMKLEKIAKWLQVSQSKVLEDAVTRQWNRWGKLMDEWPCYADYLDSKIK